MRLAVLSDVHGNAFALEAVLADLHAAAPDLTVNLGDTVWGGANPALAWALQQEFVPPTVRGNTDELVAGRWPERDPEQAAWVRAQLPADVPERLGALPTTAQVGDGEVLLAHGHPQDPWRALLFEGAPEAPRLRPGPALLAELAGGSAVRVVLVGHTHREALVAEGGVTFVNVGAVSRQFQGDPSARWALLERHRGLWNVQFRRVPYDIEGAARWAEAHAPQGAQEAAWLRQGRLPQ
ncbi:metallophosphoesterase family protein [Deinococcus multiflagellatus]|uniref:metallophosphoesterase family protein n=1 Tax=Deinococcus multiflagellatus TaxID=1656887 RepID=UPI001CCBD026|nr:metallophosphoesterase family protein [Deinococcus multiflagellatus]MBZ9716067.1 metallophosphatase family protein [Deinococcus multiflagellatus]